MADEYASSELWAWVRARPERLAGTVLPAYACNKVVRNHSTQVYEHELTCLLTVRQEHVVNLLGVALRQGVFPNSHSDGKPANPGNRP
eukprot:6391101-Pyramimonas_sp.AAC.1